VTLFDTDGTGDLENSMEAYLAEYRGLKVHPALPMRSPIAPPRFTLNSSAYIWTDC
jgi:hypothetical protein